jgi:hypothetical protein
MMSRVSMNALLLLGILFCAQDGNTADRARIFYLTVQPEFEEKLSVMDQDLRASCTFLVQASTIIKQFWGACANVKNGDTVDSDLFEEELEKETVAKSYISVSRDLGNGIFNDYDNK